MKSIIYVTSRRLLPLNSGDKILTFNILKRLSKIYKIHLFNLNDENNYTNEEMSVILNITTSFHTIRYNNHHSPYKILKAIFLNEMYLKVKTYDEKLKQELNSFIKLHTDAEYIVWDHLRSSLFSSSNQMKNVLIEHNNEADIIMERSKKVKNSLAKYLIAKQARFLDAYVKNIHLQMDNIIFLNKDNFFDAARKEPQKYILMDKLTIDFEHETYQLRKQDKKTNLLFVGSLDWAPNIDAVEWVMDEIIPLLKNKNLYHLNIVGRDPGRKLIQKINHYSNITLHSNVPSIEQYYLEADIVLMPIRSGSGINIKVLEALSYGIPMVITAFAKRGYDGLDFLPSSDTSVAFAKRIQALTDIEERNSLYKKEIAYYDEYQRSTTKTLKSIFEQ